MRKRLKGSLVSVCLCLLMLLTGCVAAEQGSEAEYWVKQGVTMECGKEFDMAILEIEGNNLDQSHYYQRLYEKDTKELNLPYNPQLDVYLNEVVETIAAETTTNMTDISILTTSGVYDGKLWYFLVESYINTDTGNRVVDIMGLHDEGVANLVVLDIGIEDKPENIPRGIIEDFIRVYSLNWKYEDVIW